MTKPEVGAMGLAALSVLGVAFAVIEARHAVAGLGALGDRVAKLEVPGPAHAAASAEPSNTDLAREIAALRGQVSALASRPAAVATDPSANPPTDASASAEAQRKAREEEEQRQQVWLENLSAAICKNLTDQLGLSAQQQTQILEVLRGQVSSFRQARLGKSGEDIKAAIERLCDETNEKLKLLLTSEQQTGYDELSNRPGGIFATPFSATTITRPPEKGVPVTPR